MQTYLLNNYNLTFFEAELGEASSPPFLLFFLKTEDYFIAAHHRHSELHRDSRQDTSKAKTLKPFAFSRKPAVSQKKKNGLRQNLEQYLLYAGEGSDIHMHTVSN